jgi:nitroreductase
MSTATRDQILNQLKWRYATKQFDPARKISDEDWAALEEVLVLTPSSYGAQPWKFFIITDPATKEKLVPYSWGQRQVADCSHHVVFTIHKNIGKKHIDAYIKRIAEVRGGTPESQAAFREMVVSDIVEGPRSQWVNEWAARQVYIALGNFMTSAALLGIDTCPMEGMEPDKYDEVLGLEKLGLSTIVACPAGYRLATDNYASLPKVRFRKEDVIVRI